MYIRRNLALAASLIASLTTAAIGARATDIGRTAPAVIPLVALPGGALALNAKVGGQAGLFLFDTGGGVTMVTPHTAAASGCRPWGQVTGFRATGERMDLPRCDNVLLMLGGRTFIAPTAAVLDLQRMMPPGIPHLSGMIALDVFAGGAITIRAAAHELIVETPASLLRRVTGATPVPIRLVRDAEGLALTVDGAVQTPAGRAWMELDTGNGGPILVGEHVAKPLELATTDEHSQAATYALVGGIPVRGPARVSKLIMDGDIGEAVLGKWDITLDLASAKAWFRPATR